MRRFLSSLLSVLRSRKPVARPGPEGARPRVEGLEDRTLLAVAAPPVLTLPQAPTVGTFQVRLNTDDLQTVQVSTDGGASFTNLPPLPPPDGTPQSSLVLTGSGSGSDPVALVFVADFNHDGLPDLAVNFGNTLEVLLGQVDGSYQLALSLPQTAGAGPMAVSAGDFNGDGETDLLVIQNQANGNQRVTLFASNGDGTFLTQQETTTPPTVPFSAAEVTALQGNAAPNLPTPAGPSPSPALHNPAAVPTTPSGNGSRTLPLANDDLTARPLAAASTVTAASPSTPPAADPFSRSTAALATQPPFVLATHALDTLEGENGASAGTAFAPRHLSATAGEPLASPGSSAAQVLVAETGHEGEEAPAVTEAPAKEPAPSLVLRAAPNGPAHEVASLLLLSPAPLLLDRGRQASAGDLVGAVLLEPGPRGSLFHDELEPPPARRGRPPSRLSVSVAGEGRIGLSEVGQLVAQAVFLGSLKRLESAATAAAPTVLQTPADSQLLVADLIQRSTEAFGKLVKGFFEMFLGRAPGEGEESGWVGMFLAGQTEEQVLSAFLGTTAFYERTGKLVAAGTPDERFIEGLYTLLLGRSATEAELSGWSAALPGLGRSGVAAFLLASTEYRSQQIATYFEEQLQRAGTPAEIAGWAAAPFDLLNIRMLFETNPERFGGR
jgi:hypothetical protein